MKAALLPKERRIGPLARLRVIGLTGGTGSGKSEVATRLAANGISVLNADQIGHELLKPCGAGVEPVLRAFGEEILTDGTIDRRKLGRLVFSDPARLAQLNTIVHPLISKEIARHCQALAAAGRHVVVLDAALLAEEGPPEPWLDGLILVTCPASTRLERLLHSRSIPRDEVERRMALQTDPERKRGVADWIIDNAGSIEELWRKVDLLAPTLVQAPSRQFPDEP